MTGGPREPALLRSDEEELARAASVLAEGSGFYLVVCTPELRAATEAYLASHGASLGAPIVLGSGDDVLAALQAHPAAGTIQSLAPGDRVVEVFQALNWHREKVLRGPAVVLWLDDLELLGRLRELAPDAYAFRDGVVIVRGDGGALPAQAAEEPPDLVAARKKLKRAKTVAQKGLAAADLANALRRRGSYTQAADLVTEYLERLTDTTIEVRRARIELLWIALVVAEGQSATADAYRLAHRALVEVNEVSISEGLIAGVRVAVSMPGPTLGRDLVSSRGAFELAQRFGLAPDAMAAAINAVAGIEAKVGRMSVARGLTDKARALIPKLDEFNAAVIVHLSGVVALQDGRCLEAQGFFREALDRFASGGSETGSSARALMNCLWFQGEIEAAARIAETLREIGDRERWQAWLSFLRGRVSDAVLALRSIVNKAASLRRDGLHLSLTEDLTRDIETASEAERLDAETLSTAVASIDIAEDISLSITGPDRPPWYPALLRHLRARAVALVPDRMDEAVALGREALALAKDQAPDLVPNCARTLAEHLLIAGRLDDARAVAEEHQALARERAILSELAYLFAVELAARARLGEAPAVLDARLAGLREVLAECDSPRVTAEVLLRLVARVPPATSHPDLVALADEAHALFTEMPMPAEEARCLEVAADVLLARGQVAEARRRYLLAHGRLERLGLALRLPLLARKIEQARG